MARVFISYQRKDTTPGWAALIRKCLRETLGIDVFRDVDSLSFGADFEEQIERVLRRCDVMLVLIGALWPGAADRSGRRRFDDPTDVHHLEIAKALRRRRVRVIPVLFGIQEMPEPDTLPEDVRPLTRRHAFFWHLDQTAAVHMQNMIEAIAGDHPRPAEAPSNEVADEADSSEVGQPNLLEDRMDRPSAAPNDSGVPAAHASKAAAELGGALSAQVIALCAELLHELPDEATRAQIERIERDLRKPDLDGRFMVGDATRADEALVSIERLSWQGPSLRFLRDRVERLRDSGPDMRMIELARWYERCAAGDVELPPGEREELERLVTARSPAERIGVGPDASLDERTAAAEDRVHAWRAFAGGALASPKARLLAGDVVRFYEQMAAVGEEREGTPVGG